MVFVAIDLPQQRDVDEGQDRPCPYSSAVSPRA